MESVDGRTVAQPSAPTVYVKARCGRRVDNNRYSVICVPRQPTMVNVDARENIPNWFVSLDCRLVGSLLFHVLVVEGVMACVDDA